MAKSKFNEDALAAAVGGAALKTAGEEVEVSEPVDKQTIIYDIPKRWKAFIKDKRHSTFSGYARAAIQEKMERDGFV
ncbi:hypothetical protein [Sulfuricurvum sp.]|uniref:hypothetical protein n=1 Tax=Sulfuricurvum sp. TaxID=2025608 RepID=UPI002605C67F|nr:hypothetical protein [Sulfuricurvum sp.]MDD2267636.1 hypothetical protein [Sulfuricurvum sp.]MDD2784972.1 hypothetical protein [Sulfuricurvum sp.]